MLLSRIPNPIVKTAALTAYRGLGLDKAIGGKLFS